MPARRRRGGSESEQLPLITPEWTGLPPQSHDGLEHTDSQNALAFTKLSLGKC